MKIKIKKLDESAVIPSYAKPGDAAMDLYATSVSDDDYQNIVYGTGLAIEIPEGHVGLLFPRSSLSKTPLFLRNHVGVIDSGYRGELIFKFAFKAMNPYGQGHTYQKGDRIGQIMILPIPYVEFCEVDELSSSERGTSGFGSTGV
jgi:dUTP pyrophosphatase